MSSKYLCTSSLHLKILINQRLYFISHFVHCKNIKHFVMASSLTNVEDKIQNYLLGKDRLTLFNLCRSSSLSASVLCSPVAIASSSLSCAISRFSFKIISFGSSSSLSIASFLIKATLCANLHVDMDSYSEE